MRRAPSELDWVSLPHLLALAEPLRCELRRRASERVRKSARRRQLNRIKPAARRIALQQIVRDIEWDRIRASRRLLILYRRFVLANAPAPLELLEFVKSFTERLNSPGVEGVRAAAVIEPQSKRAGRPPVFASRDREIVQSVAELRWKRLSREVACEQVAEQFNLNVDSVRAILKRQPGLRAEAQIRILDREARKAKTFMGSSDN